MTSREFPHQPTTASAVAAASPAADPHAFTPQTVDIEQTRNVTELLMHRVRTAPEHIAFETRPIGQPLTAEWTQISTVTFADQVAELAKGLIASGVNAGDTVMIMAQTQYLWAVVDHAALFAGAVVVPVYDTASSAQLRAIITDAAPVHAFVGTAAHGERLAAAAAEAAAPDTAAALRISVMAEAGDTATDTSTEPASLADLVALGTSVTDEQLETRRLGASLDDVATIVYTSGTTGDPKGALITHRNLVGQVLNTAAAYSEVVQETGNTVLFLPLTHVLGRALQLICIANGMRVAHLSDPKEVVQSLAILRPTFLVVVPRVLEKIEGAAEKSAREKKVLPLWRAAHRTAIAWGTYLEAADQRQDQQSALRAPLGLRIRHALFDRVFYGRLRAVMGGRLGYLLSGAATLRPELATFFRGIGVPVIEGYGLTETTAPLTGGRPGALRAGSVGTPLPGNAVRIAENGEVLAAGVGVFAGYRNAAHNADAFVDGYFRTGDLGSVNPDGSLTLSGRLKHVIVTSTGRTVSPESWEQTVEQHPLIAHAALVGTDRPYLTALVVIDTEAATEWFTTRGDAPARALGKNGITVCADGRITEEITAAIERANAAVSPSERVQSWNAIVIGEDRRDEFITPTMKLKRQALLTESEEIISELYR